MFACSCVNGCICMVLDESYTLLDTALWYGGSVQRVRNVILAVISPLFSRSKVQKGVGGERVSTVHSTQQ